MEPEVHHAESLIIAHRDLSVRSRSYRSTRQRKMSMGSRNAFNVCANEFTLSWTPGWLFARSCDAYLDVCLDPG